MDAANAGCPLDGKLLNPFRMKHRLFWGWIALQFAWVAYTTAVHEWRLVNAPTVLLETAPVDPRDLIRGDFVILNYKISSIGPALFQPPLTNELSDGTIVYVTLGRAGDFHVVKSAALEKPAQPDGPLLQGTVRQRWQWRLGRNQTQSDVSVEYGLERYYVHEGTGSPQGKLTAEVMIPERGQASIKQLYIDGKPYAEVMRTQAP